MALGLAAPTRVAEQSSQQRGLAAQHKLPQELMLQGQTASAPDKRRVGWQHGGTTWSLLYVSARHAAPPVAPNLRIRMSIREKKKLNKKVKLVQSS